MSIFRINPVELAPIARIDVNDAEAWWSRRAPGSRSLSDGDGGGQTGQTARRVRRAVKGPPPPSDRKTG